MIIDAPQKEHLNGLRNLWKEAFGDTEAFLDGFFENVFSPSRCRCVTIDGQVAAALYWFNCTHGEKRVAYLYAIATLKKFRGKGLCASLMKDTHLHLKELGYSLSMLVPASDSLFDFYARIGYTTCTFITEETVLPSKDDTNTLKLLRISAEEYGKRRRTLLPQGSVIQEGENLALLDMTAELYAADGVLIAMQRPTEDTDARIIELLGDAQKAPHIVSALGYECASVRKLGNEKAFSMSLSLEEKPLDMPKYLGLAFD